MKVLLHNHPPTTTHSPSTRPPILQLIAKSITYIFILYSLGAGAVQAQPKESSNRYAKYIKQIEQQLKRSPGSARLHTILGRLYQRAGELKKAQKCYKKALKFAPGYAHALVGLSHIALKRKQHERARRLLRRVLRKNPKHASALAELSEYYRMRAGREQKAKQKRMLMKAVNVLQSAVNLSPRNHLYKYRLGLLYLALQQFSRARVQFIAAVSSLSFHPCYRLGLAISEALLTRKEHTSLYKKLQHGRRRCAHPLLRQMAARVVIALATELAQKLNNKGQSKKAIAFFARALKTSPRSIQGHLYLTFLYYQSDQCKKAQQVLRQLLRISPKHKLARRFLRDPKFLRCSSSKTKWTPKIHTRLQILRISPVPRPSQTKPSRRQP